MKHILERLVKRPVLISVITILVMAFGIMSVFDMKVSLLPNMNMPFLGVSVVYPGASSEDVEKNVTMKLEEAVKTISEIETIETNSIDNVSILTIQFGYSVDINEKMTVLKDKVNAIDFPDGCLDPNFITVDLNASSVCSVSLTNPNDTKVLIDEANKLKDLIYNIDGVGEVKVSGLPEYSIKLKSLNGLDLTLLMVANSLSSLNYDLPLGTIIQNNTSIAITNKSNATTIEELKQMPISLKFNNVMWEMLEGVHNTLIDYNNSTIEQLDEKIQKSKNVKEIINQMENYSIEEAEKIADNLNEYKFFMELIRNSTSLELKMLYTQVIGPMANDPAFVYASEDEIDRLADKNNLNATFLKKIQRQALAGTLEANWGFIVDLRKQYEVDDKDPLDITYKEFLDTLLISEYEEIEFKVGSTEYQTLYDEKLEKLQLADEINSPVLNQIIEFRKDEENIGESVPDSYYSALLYDTKYSEDFEIIALPQFINVVRQSTFEDNCNKVRNFKLKFINENKEMTNQDYVDLYNQLKFDEDPKLPLTLDTVTLINDINYDDIITEGDSGLLVVSLDKLCHVEEIEDIEIYSEFNSTYSLLIDVYAKSDSNITDITKQVKKVLSSNDFDSSVFLLNDQAEFITDSIESVVVSMIIGAVLAVIVIFIFIGKIKTSLVVAITMPLSVLASVIMLWVQKVTLNMVSLGGLAVGIGMLVDNSIVVIESISTYRQKGYNAFDSSVKGTCEVAGSLVASTLTTICVFFPILFTTGLTKEIFADLSFAVIYSILFSLIVAIFVIPTLYYIIYRKSTKKEVEYKEKEHKLYNKIIKVYDNILRNTLKHKVIVVVTSFLVFALSTVLVLTSGFEFMPSVDKGLIEIGIEYEINVNEDEAIEFTTNTIDEIKDNIKNIDYISFKVGKMSQTDSAISAKIQLQLKDSKGKTPKICQDIRELVKDNVGDFSVTNIDGIVANITSGMSSNGVTIMGSDFDKLKEASEKIAEKLKEVNGISSVKSNISSTTTCYDFNIDKNKCEELEINYGNIVTLLRIGLSGYDVSSMKLNGEDLRVISVEFNDQTKATIEDILGIVVGYDEDVVLLSDITTYTSSSRPAIITRTDNLYSITISIESYNVDTGTITSNMNAIVNEVLSQYDNMKSSSSGVMSFLLDAFGGLVVALIISFFLLYGVMACQFESLTKPLIVIASIPLAFTGAFLGLFITGFSLDVVSFVGIIMLMGIVVNDAIVMVDKIDLNIEEGMSMYDAIVNGAKSRFRAIWMTSLTTILALIPLALAIGKGSELMQPMGIVVIGGLLLSTCVTLILIPSLYAIIKKVKTR